ncbi:hypothetical protein OOZ15_09615 [Galbibacter sp. EGI 63066]|nr:hypothetical protein [Galbibacter sp. EGI 63066]MCX2680194.1 hypothetical protein [Galbibacter sp. EGI 63066]
MKKAVAILLLALGIFMIVLGIKNNMLPPGLTGIGFLAIGLLLFKKENKL